MQVNVLIFGQLTDITGNSAITLDDIADTDTLKEQLHHKYPGLAEFPYLLAVDKEVVSSNTALSDNCTIALLPPYAGG